MKNESIPSRAMRRFLSESDHERIFSKALDKKRINLIFKAGIARVFGNRIHCHQCGQCLGKAIVRIRNGNLEIWGLHEGTVRVSFKDRVTLRFAHVHAEQCSAIKNTPKS